jgi:hypothetical protein
MNPWIVSLLVAQDRERDLRRRSELHRLARAGKEPRRQAWARRALRHLASRLARWFRAGPRHRLDASTTHDGIAAAAAAMVRCWHDPRANE